jgi:hypothetical protein
LRRDAEDAAEGNVGDVEIAGAIEGRSFKEGMKLIVTLPEGPPRPTILDAQLLRKPREYTGLDPLDRLKGQRQPPSKRFY